MSATVGKKSPQLKTTSVEVIYFLNNQASQFFDKLLLNCFFFFLITFQPFVAII
jgi:hypothetical protein